MTIRERLGGFEGVRVAWLGDGNNVCASLMVMCAKLGMAFVAATPAGYEPSPAVLEVARRAGGAPELLEDPREAVAGANVVCTDVWTSMGQEDERDQRRRDLAGHRIDADLLTAAAPDAIVLHCLPAHIGEEITEEVLYGPRCAAWDEAENRLHSEKALLALIVP
jgi:ornithine carbamoyltransferase